MKILLIGNGFDLAHGLPTRYIDFLEICKTLETTPTRIHYPPCDNKQFESFCQVLNDDEYSSLYRCVHTNCWIKHFIREMNSLGLKWIDFETEIQVVIQSICKEKSVATSDHFTFSRNIQLARDIRDKCSKGKTTFREAFSCLKDDLDELTKALKTYFGLYVSQIPVEKLQSIQKLHFNKLLSFNYTMTYSENYLDGVPDDFECCYIHGTADTEYNCDLVLGFDDHYLEDGKAIIDSVPFEKYYQRIIKQTMNNYLKWIYDIENFEEEAAELYIYGHSLAPADGDILKMFLVSKNVTTHIFYLDELDRAEKVANLAIVLGPDLLIELAGGMEKHIDFLPIEQ